MRYVAWIVFFLVCAPSAVYAEPPKVITNDALEQRYGPSSQEEDIETPLRSYGDELRDIRIRKEKEELEQRKTQRKKECADLREKINQGRDTAIESITSNMTRADKYIGPYGDFIGLMAEYKSKCMTKKQAAELDRKVERINRQNQSPSGTETYRSRADCSSDFDCDANSVCVKPPNNLSGTCMKAVNEFGGQEYPAKRSNIGEMGKDQCFYDADCPIGFRCDLNYRACVK